MSTAFDMGAVPGTSIAGENDAALLASVLPNETVSMWRTNRPKASGDYRRDVAAFAQTWQPSAGLLTALPKKPARNQAQARAAVLIQNTDRASRDVFLAAHAETLYRALTNGFTTFLRVADLVYAAAREVPGLVPTREDVARESVFPQ